MVGIVGYQSGSLPIPTTGCPFLIELCKQCLNQEPSKRPTFTDIVTMLDRQYGPPSWADTAQPLLPPTLSFRPALPAPTAEQHADDGAQQPSPAASMQEGSKESIQENIAGPQAAITSSNGEGQVGADGTADTTAEDAEEPQPQANDQVSQGAIVDKTSQPASAEAESAVTAQGTHQATSQLVEAPGESLEQASFGSWQQPAGVQQQRLDVAQQQDAADASEQSPVQQEVVSHRPMSPFAAAQDMLDSRDGAAAGPSQDHSKDSTAAVEAHAPSPFAAYASPFAAASPSASPFAAVAADPIDSREPVSPFAAASSSDHVREHVPESSVGNVQQVDDAEEAAITGAASSMHNPPQQEPRRASGRLQQPGPQQQAEQQDAAKAAVTISPFAQCQSPSQQMPQLEAMAVPPADASGDAAVEQHEEVPSQKPAVPFRVGTSPFAMANAVMQKPQQSQQLLAPLVTTTASPPPPMHVHFPSEMVVGEPQHQQQQQSAASSQPSAPLATVPGDVHDERQAPTLQLAQQTPTDTTATGTATATATAAALLAAVTSQPDDAIDVAAAPSSQLGGTADMQLPSASPFSAAVNQHPEAEALLAALDNNNTPFARDVAVQVRQWLESGASIPQHRGPSMVSSGQLSDVSLLRSIWPSITTASSKLSSHPPPALSHLFTTSEETEEDLSDACEQCSESQPNSSAWTTQQSSSSEGRYRSSSSYTCQDPTPTGSIDCRGSESSQQQHSAEVVDTGPSSAYSIYHEDMQEHNRAKQGRQQSQDPLDTIHSHRPGIEQQPGPEQLSEHQHPQQQADWQQQQHRQQQNLQERHDSAGSIADVPQAQVARDIDPSRPMSESTSQPDRQLAPAAVIALPAVVPAAPAMQQADSLVMPAILSEQPSATAAAEPERVLHFYEQQPMESVSTVQHFAPNTAVASTVHLVQGSSDTSMHQVYIAMPMEQAVPLPPQVHVHDGTCLASLPVAAAVAGTALQQPVMPIMLPSQQCAAQQSPPLSLPLQPVCNTQLNSKKQMQRTYQKGRFQVTALEADEPATGVSKTSEQPTGGNGVCPAPLQAEQQSGVSAYQVQQMPVLVFNSVTSAVMEPTSTISCTAPQPLAVLFSEPMRAEDNLQQPVRRRHSDDVPRHLLQLYDGAASQQPQQQGDKLGGHSYRRGRFSVTLSSNNLGLPAKSAPTSSSTGALPAVSSTPHYTTSAAPTVSARPLSAAPCAQATAGGTGSSSKPPASQQLCVRFRSSEPATADASAPLPAGRGHVGVAHIPRSKTPLPSGKPAAGSSILCMANKPKPKAGVFTTQGAVVPAPPATEACVMQPYTVTQRRSSDGSACSTGYSDATASETTSSRTSFEYAATATAADVDDKFTATPHGAGAAMHTLSPTALPNRYAGFVSSYSPAANVCLIPTAAAGADVRRISYDTALPGAVTDQQLYHHQQHLDAAHLQALQLPASSAHRSHPARWSHASSDDLLMSAEDQMMLLSHYHSRTSSNSSSQDPLIILQPSHQAVHSAQHVSTAPELPVSSQHLLQQLGQAIADHEASMCMDAGPAGLVAAPVFHHPMPLPPQPSFAPIAVTHHPATAASAAQEYLRPANLAPAFVHPAGDTAATNQPHQVAPAHMVVPGVSVQELQRAGVSALLLHCDHATAPAPLAVPVACAAVGCGSVLAAVAPVMAAPAPSVLHGQGMALHLQHLQALVGQGIQKPKRTRADKLVKTATQKSTPGESSPSPGVTPCPSPVHSPAQAAAAAAGGVAVACRDYCRGRFHVHEAPAYTQQPPAVAPPPTPVDATDHSSVFSTSIPVSAAAQMNQGMLCVGASQAMSGRPSSSRTNSGGLTVTPSSSRAATPQLQASTAPAPASQNLSKSTAYDGGSSPGCQRPRSAAAGHVVAGNATAIAPLRGVDAPLPEGPNTTTKKVGRFLVRQETPPGAMSSAAVASSNSAASSRPSSPGADQRQGRKQVLHR